MSASGAFNFVVAAFKGGNKSDSQCGPIPHLPL
jgi:hypothetical protein